MKIQLSHRIKLVCICTISIILLVPIAYPQASKTNNNDLQTQSPNVDISTLSLTNKGENTNASVSSNKASILADFCKNKHVTANFSNPYGVAYDGKSNLYVADRQNHRIQKIVVSSGAVTTLAGCTTSGFINGKGSAARFYYPSGVAYDGNGNLYVADQSNNMIRKIVISTGLVTTFAGTISNGEADGTITSARFSDPYGITYDVSGNLYVTDSGNNKIRKIAISTGEVTTLAGNGSWSSVDGTGIAASFYYPSGITSDNKGNLYVSDLGSYKIRKVNIYKGIVTTLAGCGNNGAIDGSGKVASFHHPIGVAYDGVDNLYVTDQTNNRIRKIVISTSVVSTVAGCEKVGSSNGVGKVASFYNPTGITYDGLGNLYVTDSGNNKIRKIVISTGIVSTL